MAIQADFSISQYEDQALNVAVAPPVSISGWNVQFGVTKRFGGGSGLITKSMASGYNGTSGVSIVDGAAGIYNVTLNSADTSGLPYGNYAYQMQRLDSGFRAVLSEGYMLVVP